MQIAVTGGSGRIGRAVIELVVAQGHAAVNIDRVPPPDGAAPVPLRQIDLADYAAVEQALQDCDALIHLAAIPGPRGHPDHVVHNTNVVASYNVLRAAAEVGIARVCQASSINAIGGAYSRWPRYDYLPLDEQHPTYAEDPYSLSKWICEQQADALVRRYEHMTIASLRFHWVTPQRPAASAHNVDRVRQLAKHLWAYTRLDAAARACWLAITAPFNGHEVFYIVAPDTMIDAASLELKQQFFPDVPLQGELSGTRGFFDCSKAERVLGWIHPSASGE